MPIAIQGFVTLFAISSAVRSEFVAIFQNTLMSSVGTSFWHRLVHQITPCIRCKPPFVRFQIPHSFPSSTDSTRFSLKFFRPILAPTNLLAYRIGRFRYARKRVGAIDVAPSFPDWDALRVFTEVKTYRSGTVATEFFILPCHDTRFCLRSRRIDILQTDRSPSERK